mmetsp:Transcript_6959/g.18208  ORF Transcript_6959/g.18208 Transcript_6959/m.18208 type:complete len:102 (-) Transcript_6959:159-464(-)|eukprot:jgi/Tetstr1/428497/TSEL_018508.t1
MFATAQPMRASKASFAGAPIRLARQQRASVSRRAVATQALFTKKKAVAADTYVCRVCGYTHTKGELPGKCPECGFPKAVFKKQEPKGKAAEEPKKKFLGLF